MTPLGISRFGLMAQRSMTAWSVGQREDSIMYIGLGTIVLIVVVVMLFMMLRGRAAVGPSRRSVPAAVGRASRLLLLSLVKVRGSGRPSRLDQLT
jgi:hypothetical protein